MNKLKWVFILLLGFSQWGQAQNPSLKFKHISVKEGLSQATINGLTQDKYGFIWVGTQDGLNRFDGYEFKIFRNDPNNSKSISNSYILSIFKDSRENLWIGTQSGLNQYDYNTERFIKFYFTDNDEKQISHEQINVITESVSKPGILWLGTNHGIIEYDINSKAFTGNQYDFIDPTDHRHYIINTIYESPTEPDILWVGTSDGLFRYNLKNNSYDRYLINDGLSNSFINYIYEDSKQKLWIGTGNGLNSYNRANKQFSSHKKYPNIHKYIGIGHVRTIFEDSNGNLWIGTLGDGLNKLDITTGNVETWRRKVGSPTSISGNNISCIFEDNVGILWVCTEGNGLNITNLNYQNIESHFHNPDNPNSLIGERVRSVIRDKNNQLWIGTTNGISIFNEKTGTYTHLQHDENNPNTISSNLNRVIYEDSKGYIWLGSRDGGLDKYNPQTKKIKHYKNDAAQKDGLSNNYIRAILEAKDGKLWIGTVSGGLNCFDPTTQKFKHYYQKADDVNSLNDNRIYALYQDTQGIIWIGTGSGITKFNPDSETFERIHDMENEENLTSSSLVMGITEDHHGMLWIATYGFGIYKYDKDKHKFTYFNESDGLANNYAYIVLEDNEHNLWISTNKGISKLAPHTGTFTNFDIEDGLQESEFNAGAHFKDEEGKLYFGGVNGLNIFAPEKLKQSKYVPPVLITDFQIFNKSIKPMDSISNNIILNKSILETEVISLSHKENIFSFSFVALDFSNPSKNKYAYKLENFETDWNQTEKRRFATYTNLSAGEYIFRVKGSSSSGVWNEEGKSIKIIIIPPWWKTKTFYTITLVSIVLLIIIIFRTRLYQLKRDKFKLTKKVEERTKEIQQKNLILKKSEAKLLLQKEEIQKSLLKLKEANATKDKFFNIIAHDLKNPFNIIQGYAEILNTEYENFDEVERKRMIKEIDRSSNVTYRLLENLLMWSRSQRKKITVKPEKLNLRLLILNNFNLYQGNANKKNINLLNYVNEEVFINADQFTIETVIGNLLNNAIKFTPENGKITFTCSEKQNQVQLVIEDNGVGMNEETINNLFRIDETNSTLGTNNEKGTGLGLLVCKEFLDINNVGIEVESKLGKGTKIKLSFTK